MAKLDVRVYPLDNIENSTKAFASITVDDLVAIKGIRVVEGMNGHFVTMPQSKDREGNYHDIAFPVSGDLRKEINKTVLDEFQAATKSAGRSQSPAKTEMANAPKKVSPDGPEL